MRYYNMIPLRNKPTWEARHSSNIIDHIISNSLISHNGDNSDLWSLHLQPMKQNQKPVTKSTYKHSYCKKKIEKFKDILHKKYSLIRHINTFSISLLTFMTSPLQELKLMLIKKPADPLDY